MPRASNPNSRTVPVTVKVTSEEAEKLTRIGGSPGKGLRQVLNKHWMRSILRSEK
jgi:hypothetical protein